MTRYAHIVQDRIRPERSILGPPRHKDHVVELVGYPFRTAFDAFMGNLNGDCLICSPYIGLGPARRLAGHVRQRQLQDQVRMKVVTDISPINLLSGATDLGAVICIAEAISNTEVRYVPRIHAKVFVAGTSLAIVGSANFTDGGFTGNLEYGVRIAERGIVETIRADIEAYSDLGTSVSLARLRELVPRIDELREAVRREQASIDVSARALSEQLRSDTDDELVRMRVHGRTANAIFEQAILYVLRGGPVTTVDLNRAVQRIHPDLCDDTVDRVINGEHFGKRWKHQVRTAQQHLKDKAAVTYDQDTRLWKLSRV